MKSAHADHPHLVNVLLAEREKPGLQYLDYPGRTVPW